MQFLSELQYGVYDECHDDTTHPKILVRYVANNASNAVDVQAEIATNQDRYIWYAAVNVPFIIIPFHFAEAHEAFNLTLQAAQDQDLIPVGYGVAKEEWKMDLNLRLR